MRINWPVIMAYPLLAGTTGILIGGKNIWYFTIPFLIVLIIEIIIVTISLIVVTNKMKED